MEEVSSIKLVVGENKDRLDTIQGVSKVESVVGSDSAEEVQEKQPKSKSKKEDKQARVEAEKQRQLKLLMEKLKAKEDSADDAPESSGSSDDFNLKVLKKKMSKKQKKKCEERVSARLKQSGALFPDDSFSSSGSSDSSGMDSEVSKRHKSRRKVKSGARIKKRPVVRTELWPHTIANEEDVEEVTSETIGLSRFLSCFSFIMLSCGKAEATGRAALLHAVSGVLECLPWSEARAFHNLVMVKLEQGKFDWRTNFTVLANQFLDRRVRHNLRSKGASAGASAAGKFSGKKSYSKGFGNPRYKQGGYNAGKGKSLYSFICKQWNEGTCSYEDRCRL